MKESVWLVFRKGPDQDQEVTHVCTSYSLAADRARGLTLLWGPVGNWIQDGNRYFNRDLEHHVWFESYCLDVGSEITPEE